MSRWTRIRPEGTLSRKTTKQQTSRKKRSKSSEPADALRCVAEVRCHHRGLRFCEPVKMWVEISHEQVFNRLDMFHEVLLEKHSQDEQLRIQHVVTMLEVNEVKRSQDFYPRLRQVSTVPAFVKITAPRYAFNVSDHLGCSASFPQNVSDLEMMIGSTTSGMVLSRAADAACLAAFPATRRAVCHDHGDITLRQPPVASLYSVQSTALSVSSCCSLSRT